MCAMWVWLRGVNSPLLLSFVVLMACAAVGSISRRWTAPSTTRLVALINDNPLNHVRAMDNESIRPYPKRERPSTILYLYFVRIVVMELVWDCDSQSRRFISKMVHWFLHGVSDSVPGKPIKLLSNLKHNRNALIRTKRPIPNASYMTHIRRECNIML